MAVYTDSPQFAAVFLPPEVAGQLAPIDSLDPLLDPLLTGVFGRTGGLLSTSGGDISWPHLLLSESSPRSQYDQLIDLARSDAGLPGGIACLAGSGFGFHGFKGRSWAAVPGNIHLAVQLAPCQQIDRFEVAFTILAALSVVDALNQIALLEGKARIKWVNDILLDDAKVGGILAYTQSQGKTVTSAVLGIGVNVETTPEVEPTPFVPRVSSVRDFLPSSDPDARRMTFGSLLGALDHNYRILLRDGVSPLLERYRELSMVVGEEVTICTESTDRPLQIVTQGRVLGLGEKLELIMEGRSNPITGGRLALGGVTDSSK
jgi:biotin-[acetyl-CoA-carboxylase] ligase BirA-like protein